MSALKLEGKVAVIAGGACGMGEAAARLFATHGANVVIADIQDELGAQLAASIGLDKCSYRHCDVTDEAQVKAAVDYAMETHGRLDVMFSYAGVAGPLGSILDIDLDEFDGLMAVNVRGCAAAVKHAARAMVAKGTRGSIICTASVSACPGGRGPTAYVASKRAVLGLVSAASVDLGRHGIRVNCISPFLVATPTICRNTGMSAEEVEEYSSASANLKGVVLKARHIAEAALFLASEESAFISGHNLVVDGATTAAATSGSSPKLFKD
ncbi:short-chain dehydrogenase reductase 3b-like [Canna indica]|uniref:Short-chain dehydrogenase reductase 3b-like n=1 Tax=Canna indica TaxID=4628 RepID=A0AAQ3KRB2_9LILI|nr:short-chain dehydrogenase reductase 3b-like [Canna indica]